MSSEAKEAALKALHDAEAALVAAEAVVEADAKADVAPGSPSVHVDVTATEAPKEAVKEPVTKYVDQGPQYLGPCAVNGT